MSASSQPAAPAEFDQPSEPKPLLINARELARMMQVSPRTLWRLLSAGKLIRPIRIGGNTRWRLDEVKDWIDRGCPPPHQEHLQ